MPIEEYFALGYVPEPRTIYAGAHKLPPAHTLTIRRGQALPEPREYWDVRFTLDNPIGEREAEAELVERLRESIRLRMIAEVPLGAFLSGGVDSSAVVAMMAGVSADPVNTCSIAFADPAYDESKFARQVADRYRTRHFVDTVESDDFDLIDVLARTYDEPYADSSALPTYRVCQLARKHVTVALSGDGGDENFAGYRRYRLHAMEERLRSAMPISVRRPAFGLLGHVYPKADWAPRIFRAKSTFQALARTSVDAYFHSVSILRDDMRQQLYSNAFKARLGGYSAAEVFRRHGRRAGTDDPVALVQYLDLKTYLIGDINTKVDRASMAHSLEVREPLMDHPLVEWLASLPTSLKVRGQEGKVPAQEGDGALPAGRPHVSAEDGVRRAAGAVVPGAAEAAPERCDPRSATGQHRCLQSAVPEARDRCSRIGPARLQLAAVDAADVRRVPPERDAGRRARLSREGSGMSLRILHVLDHSIPLHSGYTFRTRAILREQRRLGWETFHLTSPKHSAPSGPEEDVDGLHFYRTRVATGPAGTDPGAA